MTLLLVGIILSQAPAAASRGDVFDATVLHTSLADKEIDRAVRFIQEECLRGHAADCARVLAESLKSSDASERWEAARLLRRVGPDGARALDALLVATRDEDELVRWSAADAVRQLARYSRDPLAYLMPNLEAVDPMVRWSALQGVAELGPLAQRAAPQLVQLLQDEHVVVRREAARSIRSVLQHVPAVGMKQSGSATGTAF